MAIPLGGQTREQTRKKSHLTSVSGEFSVQQLQQKHPYGTLIMRQGTVLAVGCGFVVHDEV